AVATAGRRDRPGRQRLQPAQATGLRRHHLPARPGQPAPQRGQGRAAPDPGQPLPEPAAGQGRLPVRGRDPWLAAARRRPPQDPRLPVGLGRHLHHPVPAVLRRPRQASPAPRPAAGRHRVQGADHMTVHSGATGIAQAPPQAQPRQRRAAPPSEGARAERRLGLLLCAPAVVVMLAVTAYPIGYAVWLSLQRYDLRFPAERRFVGLANYATVLSSRLWGAAFGVPLLITVGSVAVELVLGMGLAMVMRWALVGRGAVRTAILIPYGIVTVVAAYSWQYAWTPGSGYLANLLPSGSAPLTEQWPAIFIIIGAEIWKTTPFMALLLLAGLSLVPEGLLRAARVDGASGWQRLTQVILPLMK